MSIEMIFPSTNGTCDIAMVSWFGTVANGAALGQAKHRKDAQGFGSLMYWRQRLGKNW